MAAARQKEMNERRTVVATTTRTRPLRDNGMVDRGLSYAFFDASFVRLAVVATPGDADRCKIECSEDPGGRVADWLRRAPPQN